MTLRTKLELISYLFRVRSGVDALLLSRATITNPSIFIHIVMGGRADHAGRFDLYVVPGKGKPAAAPSVDE